MTLAERKWVPAASETLVQRIASQTARQSTDSVLAKLDSLVEKNCDIHERECFNLNPATNVMNPRAEAMLSSRIGSRPSLGYPGDKYEMGLEAIEEIEVITAELCAEVFKARFAEIRVPSGAMANLYGFMATCQPGDTIIVPPPTIGGHVTHDNTGCAGLYGLNIIYAPIDDKGYTIDIDALRTLAKERKPKLITVGGSLNLFEHPVNQVRAIADEVGAKVLFDAAHQCGIIAGGAWQNPLQEGAHLMTMSTYKSLGGPASGLIVSNDDVIAKRLDEIAFPGMTANFDAAKSAALAVSMLDWREHGAAYAAQMIAVAQQFAQTLHNEGLPVFAAERGFTRSHQFAVIANALGGGQTLSKKIRQAGFLACGIGLPGEPVADDMNGLRIGTPELVRWGVTATNVVAIAKHLATAIQSNEPAALADKTRALREQFDTLHYIC